MEKNYLSSLEVVTIESHIELSH